MNTKRGKKESRKTRITAAKEKKSIKKALCQRGKRKENKVPPAQGCV